MINEIRFAAAVRLSLVVVARLAASDVAILQSVNRSFQLANYACQVDLSRLGVGEGVADGARDGDAVEADICNYRCWCRNLQLPLLLLLLLLLLLVLLLLQFAKWSKCNALHGSCTSSTHTLTRQSNMATSIAANVNCYHNLHLFCKKRKWRWVVLCVVLQRESLFSLSLCLSPLLLWVALSTKLAESEVVLPPALLFRLLPSPSWRFCWQLNSSCD